MPHSNTPLLQEEETLIGVGSRRRGFRRMKLQEEIQKAPGKGSRMRLQGDEASRQ